MKCTMSIFSPKNEIFLLQPNSKKLLDFLVKCFNQTFKNDQGTQKCIKSFNRNKFCINSFTLFFTGIKKQPKIKGITLLRILFVSLINFSFIKFIIIL